MSAFHRPPCARGQFGWLSIAAATLLLGGGPLPAQVVRLPPITPPSEPVWPRLAAHPGSPSEVLREPGGAGVLTPPEQLEPSEPKLPPGTRQGMFQKLIFATTHLVSGRGEGFGQNDVELRAVLALPFPTIKSPLLITPGFAVHYLAGPLGVDLPPRLFDAYAQFRWLIPATERIGLDLAFQPGLFTDFEQSSDEVIRYTGHAAVAWDWTPQAKIVLGAAYLDRFDIEAIPIGGIIWTPRDDVKYELVFPHMRIARRINSAGAPTDDVQDWIYLAAEFAGDSWAITRTGGGHDEVALRDYRLILGIERKVAGGLDGRVEVGYVFDREIRYRSSYPDVEPTDTVLLRGGLTY